MRQQYVRQMLRYAFRHAICRHATLSLLPLRHAIIDYFAVAADAAYYCHAFFMLLMLFRSLLLSFARHASC